MQTPVFENQLIIGSDYVPKVKPIINGAKHSILILMFDWRWYRHDFSCDTSILNHAFVTAKRRGVAVRAITNYAEIVAILAEQGIEAKKWNSSKILHSKMIIVDGEIVVMGSHNFSESAMTRNAETSTILADKKIATQMTAYFESLWRS